MSSLIGILVDVSGSMRNNAGSEVNEERVSWARSIFKVVDELIKHDVESSNKTFALALGCPYEPQVFDLLGSASVATEEARAIKDLSSRKTLRELIDEALDILERNEAVRVRTWGKMDVFLNFLIKLLLPQYFIICNEDLFLPKGSFLSVYLQNVVKSWCDHVHSPVKLAIW